MNDWYKAKKTIERAREVTTDYAVFTDFWKLTQRTLETQKTQALEEIFFWPAEFSEEPEVFGEFWEREYGL